MTLRDELTQMLEDRCHELELGGSAAKVVDAIMAHPRVTEALDALYREESYSSIYDAPDS